MIFKKTLGESRTDSSRSLALTAPILKPEISSTSTMTTRPIIQPQEALSKIEMALRRSVSCAHFECFIQLPLLPPTSHARRQLLQLLWRSPIRAGSESSIRVASSAMDVSQAAYALSHVPILGATVPACHALDALRGLPVVQ